MEVKDHGQKLQKAIFSSNQNQRLSERCDGSLETFRCANSLLTFRKLAVRSLRVRKYCAGQLTAATIFAALFLFSIKFSKMPSFRSLIPLLPSICSHLPTVEQFLHYFFCRHCFDLCFLWPTSTVSLFLDFHSFRVQVASHSYQVSLPRRLTFFYIFISLFPFCISRNRCF